MRGGGEDSGMSQFRHPPHRATLRRVGETVSHRRHQNVRPFHIRWRVAALVGVGQYVRRGRCFVLFARDVSQLTPKPRVERCRPGSSGCCSGSFRVLYSVMFPKRGRPERVRVHAPYWPDRCPSPICLMLRALSSATRPADVRQRARICHVSSRSTVASRPLSRL